MGVGEQLEWAIRERGHRRGIKKYPYRPIAFRTSRLLPAEAIIASLSGHQTEPSGHGGTTIMDSLATD